MIDIAELKPLIVERLKSLNPDKIILFGSFAYGTPNENSDIDLFLVKDDEDNNIEAKALIKLRDLMKKYGIGFDILSASSQFLATREDPFYKHDVLSKGKALYG
jgi:predicted nucleotidyltransferase